MILCRGCLSLKVVKLFVVINKFSKYALFMAIHHPYTASFMARVFLDNVYRLHGLPATIISDKDVAFLSLFLEGIIR